MKVEMKLGDRTLSIRTGDIAKQADGAVWVQYGETVVLATVVSETKISKGIDFLPLTIDYRERGYASGKIPELYNRREPRPGVPETITARLIDHCIRPLLPDGYRYETQVMCMVLSSDGENPTNIPAMIGASAVLCISNIPFDGPVGAVVVGRIRGKYVINPTYEEREKCDFTLFVSGKNDGVMSVEGEAKEVAEDEIVDAIEYAHEHIQEVIKIQDALISSCGEPTREYELLEVDEQLERQVCELASEKIKSSIGMNDKKARKKYLEELQNDILEQVSDEYDDNELELLVKKVFTKIEKEEVRRSILEENKRVDNRGFDEVRPITCEIGVLPRTHGSAIFTRGQTQALCVTTLGTSSDEKLVKAIQGKYTKQFILHYNFPPYSTGEVRRLSAPKRREIGHGALAEKAVKYVIADREDFLYTIRVVSEILESNASSSMAAVCGTSLALMDAGVPIKRNVAGVGVGLIKDDDQEIILTDMLGKEDFYGDMDFKVAGTRNGVTAVQMDIKIDGITLDVMRKAIRRSRDARLGILDIMDRTISKHRDDISPYAPRIYTIQIPVERIKDLIGPRGKTVQALQRETNTTIDIADDGAVQIAATDVESAKQLEEMIREITAMPEVGETYTGKVTRATDFGAFVEFLSGIEGLIHISNLSSGYVRKVEDVVEVNDEVKVKVIEIDSEDRIDLLLLDVLSPKKDRNIRRGGRGSSGSNRGGNRNSRSSRSSGSSNSKKTPRIPRGRF